MRLGEHSNPWTETPEDWHENGVPWGDFCKCSKCGLVARSTNIFDYYADAPHQPMKCQTCAMGGHRLAHITANKIAEKIISEDN